MFLHGTVDQIEVLTIIYASILLALYLLLEFDNNALAAYGFIPHFHWHAHYSWLP